MDEEEDSGSECMVDNGITEIGKRTRLHAKVLNRYR
jgi:hypothetical protein